MHGIKDPPAVTGRSSFSSTNMRSCRTEMRRSPSSNPYGMFHPRGPNLRRYL